MKLPRDQFEKLALEHLDLLYRLARRLTHDPDRAADLVQDTFVRALKASRNFDLREHGMRPWLVLILRNVHFTRTVREKHEPRAMESAPLEAAQQPDTCESLPFQLPLKEGMDEQMVEALEQLPEDQQTILLLWAVEEFSYKDIAEAMEIPIGTVMSRLHRARQKVGELLHDYAVQEGVIRKSVINRE